MGHQLPWTMHCGCGGGHICSNPFNEKEDSSERVSEDVDSNRCEDVKDDVDDQSFWCSFVYFKMQTATWGLIKTLTTVNFDYEINILKNYRFILLQQPYQMFL